MASPGRSRDSGNVLAAGWRAPLSVDVQEAASINRSGRDVGCRSTRRVAVEEHAVQRAPDRSVRDETTSVHEKGRGKHFVWGREAGRDVEETVEGTHADRAGMINGDDDGEGEGSEA